MITNERYAIDATRQFRLLGACWIVYGVLRLGIAIWLFSITNTATVMFGALLNRVPDPFAWMNAFHVVYAGVVVFSAICGIFGIVAGVALLAGHQAGRGLAIAAGILSLSGIPVGTTLGIYTLIVMLAMLPRRELAAAATQAPAFKSPRTATPSY